MSPERFQDVEEIYHAVREREPSQRSAFLAGACGGDEELRREVESLLAQDPNREGMLDRPAAGLLEDATVTTLAAGVLLGPYKIEAPIGAGGMGEVYRAIDTRLGRAVAIKTLRQKFSDRFEREARAISALNHPHICTLHDVGPNYLVMELLEGETLEARLRKGPLPMDQALRYGAEIADALAAAHAKGIVHRDLKPGNIMLTKSGVKVLDFGLAKSLEDGPLTGANAVMGTPKYMAPEQRQGKECDARTDIYALGLVLREMAANPPPHLARVVERCLAPEPENRWHSAKDVQFELEAGPVKSPATRSPAPRAPAGWIAAAGVLALALGIAVWGWLHASSGPRPVTRWAATLPDTDFVGSSLAISRDGTHLAYSAGSGGSGGSSRIWIRSLDRAEGKPIPGTDGGLRPLFSPDGQWIAYVTGGLNGVLKKVPAAGGAPVTLCDGPGLFGGSWGEDDRIIFSDGKGLRRVSASGGPCESITTADPQKGELHRWPQILPGGQSLLFTIGMPGDFDAARIAVLDLKSGGIRVLLNGGSCGRYVPSGHLVYVRGGAMFAVPFDLKRLAVTGSETPVIEGIFYNQGGGLADYAFSASGLLVYREAPQPANLRTLEWRDRNGHAQPQLASPQNYQQLRLSPDGLRAAVAVRRDVWILELARGVWTRLTVDAYGHTPIWTPDGKRVVFSSGPFGTAALQWAPVDGSRKPELLLANPAGLSDSFTPDGKTLLYESVGPAHIWTLQPAASGGDGKPRPLFEATSLNEADGQVSPDGHWVAYTSDESGKNDVSVRPFPGPGERTPISIEGGREPRWSRDGRELFYRDPDKRRLMVVDIQTGPTVRAGQAHELFALGNVPWDVAPDGKRFLVVKELEAAPREAKMQAVVNWFEELRQKAPKR